MTDRPTDRHSGLKSRVHATNKFVYKADLARARTRRAEGDWESIEVTSGEAQLAAIVANDWYKEEYGIRSFVKYIMDAKKKVCFHLNMPVCIYLGIA